MNNTYSAKPSEIEHKWYLIDATDLVLGRLASITAKILKGKHKPMYTPHLDCGDNVIIINADKVKLTGTNKLHDKTYYRHTGYPGGIKSVNAETVLAGEFPERVIIKAVQRMISRNKLGNAQMTKLKVYAGAEHPHIGQTPEVLDVAAMNPKNKRS